MCCIFTIPFSVEKSFLLVSIKPNMFYRASSADRSRLNINKCYLLYLCFDFFFDVPLRGMSLSTYMLLDTAGSK